MVGEIVAIKMQEAERNDTDEDSPNTQARISDYE